MKLKKWPTLKILRVKVDFPNLEQAVAWVEEQVKYNKVGQITTPNAEQVVLAQADAEFRQVLNRSALSICDGAGLLWAAKCRGSIYRTRKRTGAINRTTTIYHRLSGVDLMLALCRKAAEKRWKVMFVGGREGVAKTAANNLTIKPFSHLAIKTSVGASDICHETAKERQGIIKEINQFKPHLLFVAYGAPWQEKWIAHNLPQLKVNVAMGVGGAFDYLAGKVRRAPKLVRDLSLEWLWRLFLQPWRIKRQLALLKFLWLVMKES